MDIVPLTLEYYRTGTGRRPFREWRQSLDTAVRQIVDNRLSRLGRGLLGDSEYLGGGLWELRLDVGPGYRIYAGRLGTTIIILLTGGSKKWQSSDIAAARELWADHLSRGNP